MKIMKYYKQAVFADGYAIIVKKYNVIDVKIIHRDGC